MGPVTDLPMRWRFWLPVWVLVVLVVAISIWMIPPVAASGGSDVAECAEWGKAGKWTLTRCEDDYTGEVCIVVDSGMMSCKLD